jgi:hypothetical protein
LRCRSSHLHKDNILMKKSAAKILGTAALGAAFAAAAAGSASAASPSVPNLGLPTSLPVAEQASTLPAVNNVTQSATGTSAPTGVLAPATKLLDGAQVGGTGLPLS